jgi:hypothetical protein
MVQIRYAALMLVLTAALCGTAGQAPRFLTDDPIQAMPPPLPLKKIAPQQIGDLRDFLTQSRRPDPPPRKPAGAINTLGEVPDSEWFTNRHAQHRMSRSELQQGPPAEAPVPPFTVTGSKHEGITPGFKMRDARGRQYFVKTDPIGNPEMATGSDVIVSRFLFAIGYNTPKNDAVDLKISDLKLSNKATIKTPGERSRPMIRNDVEQMVNQIPHYPDGSFRIMASLAVPGEPVGPFQFEGTRQDDPNDIVPHEDRRDLRGLYVFSAWLNNTDAKAENSLDVLVSEEGISFVRHYLLDFGSALGSDGDFPKDPRLGHEYMVPKLLDAVKQIVTFGMPPAPWEQAHFPKLPAVGNFESQVFDPDSWKPDYPNPAFIRRLPDDEYWAAKQVMAFTDDDIRAIVEAARFTDPRSTDYIVTTLAERRDKIGRTFFSKVLPLDHFRVENNELMFEDLAVRYRFQPPQPYSFHWRRFDNVTQAHAPVSGSQSAHLPDEAAQAPLGSYFEAVIQKTSEPGKSVSVYLRKERNGYKVVGIDRMP